MSKTDFFFYTPAAAPEFRFRLIEDGNGSAIVYQPLYQSRLNDQPEPPRADGPLVICNYFSKLPRVLKDDPTVRDHFQPDDYKGNENQ